MAYPFEKMTTSELRSKLHDKRNRGRSHCDNSDRSAANPLNINLRRTNPNHCQTNENQSNS